ncbi:hypothetical protein PG994_000644 [Apiospora phragmitis]|uniref:Uncharacterized protein n=1 Tax=Apiospora phragmitis TaxID=2905665 RepID=A0ABR1X703_9PEZI
MYLHESIKWHSLASKLTHIVAADPDPSHSQRNAWVPAKFKQLNPAQPGFEAADPRPVVDTPERN